MGNYVECWAILWRHKASGELHIALQEPFDALDTPDFDVVGRKSLRIEVGEKSYHRASGAQDGTEVGRG